MSSFSEDQLIRLKDQTWLDRQLIAGRVASQCIKLATEMIQGPSCSLKEIERTCEDLMLIHKCIPTFKNYRGTFPGAICASVNNQLVHGIPSDYRLQNGDVVKIDLGVTFEGAIADTATTVIHGQAKKLEHIQLLETCKLALDNAIKSIQIGKQLGVIGSAINHTVKQTRFGLITNYGGHGIDWNKPHAQPFVANKAMGNSGIRIQPGLVIAIEPMVVVGDNRTRVLSDGWTVVTNDVGAHEEHSIFVAEDKIHVVTARL